MALLAFVLAAIQAALVALGVDFPAQAPIRNVGVCLFLLALGFCLPGAVAFVSARRPAREQAG